MRRGSNLQHPPVSTAEQFHPLAERIDVAQYCAAIPEELLAFRSQDEAASNAVK